MRTVSLIAFLAVLAGSTTAAAQPSPEPSGPEEGLTEPTGEAIPEEATPEEVQDAEVVERQPDGTAIVEVSRLTPVLPDTSVAPSNAYQLYWEIDIPVLIGGAALAATRVFRSGANSQRAQCLIHDDPATGALLTRDHCDPNELNAFDRLVAGRYDPSWGTISDYGAIALAIAPIPLIWADEGFLPMLNDMVVIYQSALLAVAFSGMATLAGNRARPFVYGQEAPEEERTGGNGGLSFISSHTSFAFAMATATFWTVERRHGDTAGTWAIALVGGGTAALVGVSRVLAGSHFPTDVLTGMLVGVGMGTLVPTLHGSPVRVTASASKESAQAGVALQF